jgi:DNA (cytosine-5)-methyltransferase 1
MMRELVIDSFAGGGGASMGIMLALGRGPDYAINHDAEALAMHAANHTDTIHLSKNIWQVDPIEVVGRRPVGLAWFSPDCKHFSKAKGGKPVKREIRDLAWTVVLWAKRVRPRVIILENVEEFRTWGPLIATDNGKWKPCPERSGATFDRWVSELRRLGYRVEWRELRACDYGAPTIRKRLFLIARRDGQKIVWPKPTHGKPTDPDVIAGRMLPWRTAAEIIDWSLPCHSIFLTREEGRAVGVNRPLADATMARIAKGVQRYVLEAAKPFLVPVTHQGDERVYDADEPLRTITTAQRGEQTLVAPLIARTDMHKSNAGCVYEPAEPMRTITTSGGHAVLAAHLQRQFGNSVGSATDHPAGTITAGGGGKTAIVSAFLAQHNLGRIGHDARSPVSTITQRGTQQAVVSAGLLHMKGSDRRMSGPDEPARTVTAGGWHQAELRAFLMKYYGTGGQDQDCADPLHTASTRARFGLVLVEGEPYQIVDIGMRMLSRRELFRAQGFPDSYVVDRGVMPDGREITLTNTASIRMCGNSVCPPMAEALVRANYVSQSREIDEPQSFALEAVA